MSVTNRYIQHFPEIRYSIMYFVEDHYVEFRCYKMRSVYDEDDEITSDCFDDDVQLMPDGYFKGTWDFEGYIKWDGCSNWKLSDNAGMFHMCGVSEFDYVHTLMNHMYSIAREKMANANY